MVSGIGNKLSVYKVLSNDVYINLALEHWIWKNTDFQNNKILMFWRNSPTVVIGRHQNPWLECDVGRSGVQVARRQSGGGAVYHDMGNLNVTVFTNQQEYNRKENLAITCAALKEKWNLNLSVNKKHDIILNNTWKVSGSSSRLARGKAYHHFTLLVNTDLQSLQDSLTSQMAKNFVSRSSATESVRSSVCTLNSVCKGLEHEEICDVIADQFYLKHGIPKGKIITIDQMNEETFPGIAQLIEQQKEYEWIFGKTPKFSIKTSFYVMKNKANIPVHSYIEVQKGMIEAVKLIVNSSQVPLALINSIQDTITGIHFWPIDLSHALSRFINDSSKDDNDLIQQLCNKLYSSIFR